MTDLVKRLRIKAGMIEMGEMIAWGSDSALMREAADALEMAERGAREDYKLVPLEPTLEHIDSIAMRYRHDFGLLPEDQRDNLRRFARQMYEECTGQGFYQIQPAPVVEGEPLGYVVPRMAARLGKGELCGISVLDRPEDGHTLPVYLAPHPAEHQPDASVLVETLKSIEEWVMRYADPKHPVATVARKALADYHKQGG